MTKWVFVSDLQLVLADGSRPRNQCAADLVSAVGAQDPDFVVHGGDCIGGTTIDHEAVENPEYPRVHEETWELYRRTIAPLVDRCPVHSTLGNHDHTFPDLDAGLFCHSHGRGGESAYYSETIGDVQLIVLDEVPKRHQGGFPAGTEQEAWLRDELARPTDARCRVVVGHYPIYMSAEIAFCEDETLRYNEESGEPGLLLALLLEAGVDLYLCGHTHIYERVRFEGLTQVSAGADGVAYQGLLDMAPSRYLQAQDERQSYVSFALVDDHIEGTAVSLDGVEIDSWAQPLNGADGNRSAGR